MALLLFCGMPLLPSSATENPMVHRQGTRIVDRAGNLLFLRSMCLGGWLTWEGWIFGGPITLSETRILDRLTQLVGADQTSRFYQAIHENFVTDADIAQIAAIGFNCVRVPINHRLLEDDSAPFVYKEAGWQILDRLIASCAANKVYVILDLHATPGGQGFMMDVDRGHTLWQEEANKKRTVALWRAIASRYRDNTTVCGYDLINEPNPPSPPQLVTLYRQIVAAIRQVDPYHMVILEGCKFSSDFSALTQPLDPNEALSFHMYTWFGDNRRKQLDRYAQLVQSTGLPLWNGESGENNANMVRTTVDMFEAPNSLLSGWSYWTWKKVPNRYGALVGINQPESWKNLMKWISGRPRFKPSPQGAVQAMREFVSATMLKNCVVDASMANAIIHSPLPAGGAR